MSSNITEKAMLVRLSMSQWTARKHDKRVSQEVATAHGTTTAAGRYNKVLIAGEALTDITRIAGEARTYHYSVTLPWTDKGARILPAVLFMEYTNTMRVHRAAFDGAVAKFCEAYPELYEDARIRLNGLFVESDYPTMREIRKRFDFDVAVDSLPNAADFRVDLNASEIDAIRADIQSRTNGAINSAVSDIWTRVHDAVSHMAERLRAYEVTPEGKTTSPFRDTLVTNLRERVGLLPALNITGDSALAAMADKLSETLCKPEPQALRDDSALRNRTAAEAESILANMAGYCAAA